jgi:hypothetical protein
MKSNKILIIFLIIAGAATAGYFLLAHKTTPATPKYSVGAYLGYYIGMTTIWYRIYDITATNYLMTDSNGNLFTFSISSVDNDSAWSLAPIIG